MAQYRNNPVVVLAEQWFPGQWVKGVHGAVAGQSRERACYPEAAYDIDRPSVVTIHGQVVPVEPGDWIVTEADGIHHYPCKPDVFEATYSPVDTGVENDPP